MDILWKNLKYFIVECLKQENSLDKLAVEKEKNEIMVKFLNLFNKEKSWIFILKGENSVFKW